MNRSESRETNSHINGQLLFDKGAKTIQWGERIVLSTSGAVNGYPCAKELHWTGSSHKN